MEIKSVILRKVFENLDNQLQALEKAYSDLDIEYDNLQKEYVNDINKMIEYKHKVLNSETLEEAKSINIQFNND